jgi:uncharacterized membrane protein
MTVLAMVVVLVSSRYFLVDPAVYFEEQRPVYEDNLAMLLAHVGGASVALLAGPFQFLPRLRARRRRVHRIVGRLYLAGIVIGGLSGLALSTIAYGGPVARFGFGTLGVLWLLSGAKAFTEIRAGRVAEHRAWMVRNFALTFAAVTLRLWLPLLTEGFGVDFDVAYPLVAWLCWVPNLAVAEMLVARRRRPLSSPVPASP